MKLFADLHIHSHYSRATSKNMNIENLDKHAKIKGIDILGTGDFTHPLWFKEMKSLLREVDDSNLYQYKTKDLYYMLTAEISLMYSQGGKGRRIHVVIFAPNFEVVRQINDWLLTKGRLDYDGRPIFGFPATELVENLMSISKDIMIIPAHAWTPWFGILGSKSGFDSIEECFQDQTKHIHAIETGLSSDPSMNWRLSSLDKFSLVSNSDCHSYYTWRMGREANVFDLNKVTYKNIVDAIKKRDKNKFLYTIEVDPAYGKYHWDGHRNCNVSMSPKESRKVNKICPSCGKPLTIGVEYRVEELADRKEGFVPKNAIPFKKLLPLSELLAAIYNTQVFTKKVLGESEKLIKEFGSELNILLNVEENKLKLLTKEKIVKAIIQNREGKLKVQPGYDGVYGKLIMNDSEKISKQESLKKFIKK